MRVWSIQPQDVWESLYENGIWRAQESFVYKEWRFAYQWMMQHLGQRISPSPVENIVPIWVWRLWRGSKQPRPDLRFAGHLPKGTAGVRMELEMPEDQLLLSDFDLWHYVLNYFYLPSSQRDAQKFDARIKKAGLDYYRTKPLPDANFHAEIERSWERVFDIDRPKSAYARKREDKIIQGVTWELKLSDVQAVTQFIAR